VPLVLLLLHPAAASATAATAAVADR